MITPLQIACMHSRLSEEEIKTKYPWVLSAMKEYGSRVLLEELSGDDDDENEEVNKSGLKKLIDWLDPSFASVIAKAKELMEEENTVEQREPKLGEVWKTIDGRKFVVTSSRLQDMAGRFYEYEFVCDRAHADGDFSYMCTSNWCRCSQ